MFVYAGQNMSGKMPTAFMKAMFGCDRNAFNSEGTSPRIEVPQPGILQGVVVRLQHTLSEFCVWLGKKGERSQVK